MKKGLIASLVLAALQFIAAAVLFFYLPEQIPIHWNMSGAVDGFGDKIFIFLMPSISLAIVLLLYRLPAITPKGENIKKSGKLYPLLMIMISLLMAVLLFITAATSFGYPLPINQIVFGLLGVLFLFIGNYLPKVKPNYTMGIRLPWTLASESVWVKTHRFGGPIFFAIGLLFIVGIFLNNPVNFILPFAGLSVGLIAITVYSFKLYKKTHDHTIER